ncbi:MAG: acetate--CoA ligase family protein, partial [Bacteroidetes bacterium]|nr:acetate--CoA ligase family protein [Bacteroidota bacterium]
MLHQSLINPRNIAVIGGSDNLRSPGGKVLKNLIDQKFKGEIYVVNLKNDIIQGLKSYRNASDLPDVDLAIFAVAARYCKEAVQILAMEKNTRGFIILSAGFSEDSKKGAEMEKEIVKIVDSVGGSLIGPNCIGIFNQHHTSVFTSPIPRIEPKGCEFISGSGATAVFTIESGIKIGLTFSSVFSVGNSAQTGVEEVLKHLDETFDPKSSSRIKLLYIEQINKPVMFLKHASSLIKKGCKIAAIKSGASDAGSRAASSHTGALASPDLVVRALFKKAGIIYCSGREELVTVASIFLHKQLRGKNIAIITHAGGPAVMLTDSLSKGGLNIPPLSGPLSNELLSHLLPGSSVSNPIDFLATGSAEHLSIIIDYCENKFDEIDGMVVVFGSPGLFNVDSVYEVLHEKMKVCKKPIYPVLPSVINAESEIKHFIAHGRGFFPDEVVFGDALTQVYVTQKKIGAEKAAISIDKSKIRAIIDKAPNGYLKPDQVNELLDAMGIPRVNEAISTSLKEAVQIANEIGYPVVMKVVGPVHKTDVGGVVLNVKNADQVQSEYNKLIKIKDCIGILIQSMETGTELFAGAKNEGKFGHMVLCGIGGIFIEILKDFSYNLVPVNKKAAIDMIRKLKSYGIIKGTRGLEPVNEDLFA